MMFHSPGFLLGFLPVVFVVYVVLQKTGRLRIAAYWMTIVSLGFYAWWKPVYLPILLASILFNFFCGARLMRTRRKAFLIFGIGANLLLLGYFKYTNFFLGTLNQFGGFGLHALSIGFPLAISFFTFTQIAYLVDAYRGKVHEHDLVDYTLFVTFFPHLLAGPIVHHAELMPQFRQKMTATWENVAVGLTILIIGLFKKVILADTIGTYADVVFNGAAAGTSPVFFEAWIGVLAYTFQIYFDFSGYSDMAVGIAKMMGIVLPWNFDAPYRASSIREFWRRWHMTLSRFLQEYLYIPLGGSRRGDVRTIINLLLTMLLAGLWHGAGWTFVVWGGLHGVYLVIHRLWLKGSERLRLHAVVRLIHCSAVPLTFFAVVVGWAFFRAADLPSAVLMLKSMFGFHGWTVSLQDSVLASPHTWKRAMQIITGLALIAWLAPTTQNFLRAYQPEDDRAKHTAPILPITWKPNAFFAFCTAVLVLNAVTFLFLAQEHVFLYFQF